MSNRQPVIRKCQQHGTSKDATIIREMIRHEDDVIDQRFTWLCQIQGFLFTALALAWKEPTAHYLVLLLCLVGIAVAITTWFALRSAWQGVEKLLKWWDEKVKSTGYVGPVVFARRVDDRWTSHLRPWNILPLIFSLAWGIVLVIKILDS